MVATTKRLSRLTSVRLFSECDKKELAILDRLADEVEVAAGETVVEQGEYGHACYIVMEGRATATRDGESIGSVGPGEAIGELAVIQPGPRTATVTAVAFVGIIFSGDDKKSQGAVGCEGGGSGHAHEHG